MDYSKLTKKELVRLLQLRETPKIANTPQTIADYLSPWSCAQQEYFLAVLLDGAHHVANIVEVSKGLVNKTLVHPRELFAPALEQRATAIVVAHNHPSGELEPSEDDIATTRRLRKAGAILGIEILDHIIFSKGNYRSMLESGEFDC